jgi:hypothetical protein
MEEDLLKDILETFNAMSKLEREEALREIRTRHEDKSIENFDEWLKKMGLDDGYTK